MLESTKNTKQQVSSLSNLLNNFKGKIELESNKISQVKTEKTELKFIHLLEIKGDEYTGSVGVSISKKNFKIGEITSVDLRSE